MILGLILEGLVGILLVVTVVYCAILDRRLRALRDGQDGLKAIIEGLDAATLRAQTGVAELRVSGEAVSTKLTEQVGKARSLADELEIMVEAATRLADRLESGWAATTKPEPPRALAAPPVHATPPGPPRTTLGSVPPVRSEPPFTPGAVADEDDETSNKWEDALLKALREAR